MQWHRPSAGALAPVSFHRPRSRVIGYLKALVAALAVMFAMCAAPNRPWSAARASTLRAYSSPEIWLFTSGGSTDVTSTYYVSNGLSYVVYNGQPIQVVLDYEEGHVYGSAGNIIGYLVG